MHLTPHLTVDELRQRYTAATSSAEARRYHARWLIAHGHTAQATAELVGLSDTWVRTLVQRYIQAGPTGLRAGRAHNRGHAPLLPPDQQQALFQALQAPPLDGGSWTGRTVAAWITRQTGIPTQPQRGGEDLRRLGCSTHAPRPRHVEAATAAEQATWKKRFSSAATR